jgi:predicted molibdopterin-dependent oxidoreductase YjgC
LVVARPLQTAARFLQAAVAHTGVHQAQAAQFVPDAFGIGRAPIVSHASWDEALDVVAAEFRSRRSNTGLMRSACSAARRPPTTELGAKFERAHEVKITPTRGRHLSAIFEVIGARRDDLLVTWARTRPIPKPTSTARLRLLGGLEFLVVQDVFYTSTARMADVVLPGSAGWCKTEGTVTNGGRRVQRVRRVVPPPEGVRDDIEAVYESARSLGEIVIS